MINFGMIFASIICFILAWGFGVASAGSGLFSFMANNVVRLGYVDRNALSWGLVFVYSVRGRLVNGSL